ncbi:MAG: hypothetical protein U0531_07375 [Dehalococcoidia bacterium]
MTRFQPADAPKDVVERVRARAADGWERVFAEEGMIAVAKLRLAGVYDDRHDGTFMLRIRLPGGHSHLTRRRPSAGSRGSSRVSPRPTWKALRASLS